MNKKLKFCLDALFVFLFMFIMTCIGFGMLFIGMLIINTLGFGLIIPVSIAVVLTGLYFVKYGL